MQLRTESKLVVRRHLRQLELQQAHRLVDGRVGLLGAEDNPRTATSLARRGERGDRRRRGRVLDVPVPGAWKTKQLAEPAHRDFLELVQGRGRAPQETDVVQ